jgi:hypothetical protein
MGVNPIQLHINPLLPCVRCAEFGAEYTTKVDEWTVLHPDHPKATLRALIPVWKCTHCGHEWDNEPAADDVRYVTEQEYFAQGRQ